EHDSDLTGVLASVGLGVAEYGIMAVPADLEVVRARRKAEGGGNLVVQVVEDAVTSFVDSPENGRVPHPSDDHGLVTDRCSTFQLDRVGGRLESCPFDPDAATVQGSIVGGRRVKGPIWLAHAEGIGVLVHHVGGDTGR